ncbi:DUF4828 domain-containing protein [Enterococcus sp. LJL99]
MKKNWSFLLGASLITGVVGSVFLKNKAKKHPTERSEQNLYQSYKGNWWFVNRQKATQHTLKIEENLSILIDGKKLRYALIELTKDRLVVQDEFGYHLIIQSEQAKPIALYDEADDATYPLEAINPLET